MRPMPPTHRECKDLLRTMLRRDARASPRIPLPSRGGAGASTIASAVVVFLAASMSLVALAGFAAFLSLAGGAVAGSKTGTLTTTGTNITGNFRVAGGGGAAAAADDDRLTSTVRRTAVAVDGPPFDWATSFARTRSNRNRLTDRAHNRESTETRLTRTRANVTETFHGNDPNPARSKMTGKPDRSRRRRRIKQHRGSSSSERTRSRGLQNAGRGQTIRTTLDSNGKSFGSMFVMHNNNGWNDLLIETLSVHVDVDPADSTRVEVWTRPDSYVGYEEEESVWTMVCNATVRSMGTGQATFIPVAEFTTVTISWGGAQAFYVTLPTENLLHTSFDGDGDGGDVGFASVFTSNEDLSILAGAAISDYPFARGTGDPAVFNGEIRYNIAPAAARAGTGSTPPPTISPPPLGYKGLPEKCTTTFIENNGAYGAYFTINAKQRIRVTSIDFHTDKTHALQVNVYTRAGDYRGFEHDAGAWRIVASATVRGKGSGNATAIPGGGGGVSGGRPELIPGGGGGERNGNGDASVDGNFLPVDVLEGQSQSFFVTLSTEDLRYSNTDEAVGATIVSTSAMDVLVGTGSSGYPVGYPPFDPGNRLFNSRAFNGVVHYLTAVREDYASNYPYPATLPTTLDGGTKGFGAMFDVVATVPADSKVLVTGIDFHTDLDDTMPRTSVEVYTKLGSYAGFEDTPGAWTRIAEVDDVAGWGPGRPTPIVGGGGRPDLPGVGGGRPDVPGVGGGRPDLQGPTATVEGRGAGKAGTVISPFFDPVTVEGGQTRSFYVTLPTTNMSYTKLDSSLLGTDFKSDDNLRILVGAGVAYPFGGGVGRTYSPRMFNGAVRYAVADPPPTSAPSSAPSTSSPTPQPTFGTAPRTPLITQQKIQIAGVSARRLLKGARIVGSGGRRRLELAEESLGFFENVTQQFLAEEARKSGVNVKKATVATELDLEDVEGLEEGGGDEGEGEDGADAGFADGDGDGSSSPPPVLNMYTTIEGEYLPPPYVDFGILVEDTFEEKGDVFVQELKEDPTGFFEEATGVETVQVSFPLPAPPEPPVERSNAKLIASVSGGCGGVFLLVIAAVIVCVVLKRRRRKTAAAAADEYSECKSFEESFEEDDCLSYEDDKSGMVGSRGDKSGDGTNGSTSEPGVYRSSSLEPIRKAGGEDGDGRDEGRSRGKLRRRNSLEYALRSSSSLSLEPIREEREKKKNIRTQ